MSNVNPYAFTAAEIEAEWNKASRQLQAFLAELGYGVENAQVPRAQGCTGGAE